VKCVKKLSLQQSPEMNGGKSNGFALKQGMEKQRILQGLHF